MFTLVWIREAEQSLILSAAPPPCVSEYCLRGSCANMIASLSRYRLKEDKGIGSLC